MNIRLSSKKPLSLGRLRGFKKTLLINFYKRIMQIEKNQQKYNRVTEVLGIWQDTSFFTEEGRERGTAVHQACSAYAKKLWHPALKDEWRGYTKSFICWFDATVSKVILSEKRFFDDKILYSGQIDLLCILKGDTEPTVIDIKTGIPNPRIVNSQTAAYRFLVTRHCPKRAGYLLLKQDGSPATFKENNNIGQSYQAFLNTLYAKRYFTGE